MPPSEMKPPNVFYNTTAVVPPPSAISAAPFPRALFAVSLSPTHKKKLQKNKNAAIYLE